MNRKFHIIIAALVVVFCMVGTAGAATVPVTNLTGSFHATNSTVTLTPDGVHFGTYANGGALGGTLITHDYDGLTLADLTDVGYTFNYRVGDQPEHYTAAPYLRVFLDTGEGLASVVLDPGYCTQEDVPQSEDLSYQMVGNDRLRYNDDGCDSADNIDTWDNIAAAHGDLPIAGILVTQGNSVGHDVSAMLRSVSINGDTFAFGAPQAGPVGPQGPAGENGAPGEQGSTGAAGTNGANGAPGIAGLAGPSGPQGVAGTNGSNGVNGTNGISSADQCRGDGTRVLHVVTRKGFSFVSSTATLRGKKLAVSGRTITVKLPAVEGNYNIRITAKYKKAGKTRTFRYTRNLSVACS